MAADLFHALLPEQLLLGLILLLMLLEICGADRRFAGLLFTLAAGAGCGVLLLQLGQGYTADVVPGEIRVDRFALLARLVILGCGVILGLCSPAASDTVKSRLLLASSLLGGLVIMVSAGFIPLFMGIEMLSLPAFALMVHGRGLSPAGEGAFKYLLMSSVASALILFGLSLAYGSTGSLAIGAFAAALPAGGPPLLVAGLLLLSGFFLKAALFPFHGWAPDAYGSARLPVTAFLASVVKGAVVLGLVRILSAASLDAETVAAVTVLSVASIFYGNVTAIRQVAFRRLLAYSSIAHAGYMMFALTDGSGGRTEALLYYVAVYAVTTIVACTCFRLLAGEGDELALLEGAFAARPVPALLLGLSALSLAGIPPLPGFLAKFFIFRAVIASGHLAPAVLAFAGSYVGVVYYLGIVLRLFRPSALPSKAKTASSPCRSWGGVLLGTAVLLLFMLVPGVFNGLA
ncbi:proton-conducting transporter membrane subunit [Geobacter sp.]|uniref:NADH-quinone oxidoreductase subunit N n=1 Tax=Geobacter sp. TaxID=46610 RepID=UPI002621BC94|nr:proton-conducting transporter membrane subunit [Geobacter sp.]